MKSKTPLQAEFFLLKKIVAATDCDIPEQRSGYEKNDLYFRAVARCGSVVLR